jgi:hypothetical protein
MAALRAALKTTILVATLAAAALTPLAVSAQAATHAHAACANHLCTRLKPHVRTCRQRHHRYEAIARCSITRAARHYHQSVREAHYIAWRESRYRWWVTNSSAHRGMYQFTDTLWAHTPYHRRSVYSPRWSSLAAMWLWARGGKHHWAL